MEFPDHQQQPNQEYASMPAPFRPVAGGEPMADEATGPEPSLDAAPSQEPEPKLEPQPALDSEPELEPQPALEPEPALDSASGSMLPTMTDLRSIATDLDDIDEILARLDDDESAPDDEPNQGITDPAAENDPEDQDPLLATR